METKLNLINLLEKNKGGTHLRELSRLLKTGLPNLIRYVNILKKEKVVKKYKDANTIKVKLKEGIKTLSYLKQVNTERFLILPYKIKIAVNDFLNELKTKPLIVIIFGSYAKGNYTEDSDIDILLIYQTIKDGTPIENVARRISMRTNTQINPIYLDYPAFEKNFLNIEHDFSKELKKEVIIMSGIELYYSLLWRFLD